jgi:hypothetical protein
MSDDDRTRTILEMATELSELVNDELSDDVLVVGETWDTALPKIIRVIKLLKKDRDRGRTH